MASIKAYNYLESTSVRPCCFRTATSATAGWDTIWRAWPFSMCLVVFSRQMMTGFGGYRGNGTLYSYCGCWQYFYVSLFMIDIYIYFTKYINFTIIHYFVFMILLFSLFSNLSRSYIAWLHPSRQHIPIGSFAGFRSKVFGTPRWCIESWNQNCGAIWSYKI